MKKLLLALLVVALPALAAKYDPDQDRTALRQAAISANDAAARAAAVPLVPERSAEISADLDQSVVQADLASNAAKSLETGAFKRAAEMASELAGHGAPAPAAATKDLGGAAAAQRERWKSLSKDHDDLLGRVNALPDSNADKARLKSALSNSAASLAAADASLTRAEAGAAAMTTAVSEMELAQKRAQASNAELTAADSEVVRLDGALPPPVNEAKAATGLLGQEPQGPNRTRAGQKISVPRDITGQLFSAADRASNRADDYRSRSAAFERAQAAFDSAKNEAAGTPDVAKKALDDASSTQDDVRARLDHLKP
ncbi:MAG TPA: hypothetical protein VN915_00360 [Elusimicrobiota bacterium]|nr:hypothetical protein [Elusimicrobiota bacterium]